MPTIKYCEHCDKNGESKKRFAKTNLKYKKEAQIKCHSVFLGFAYFERIDEDATVCPFCGYPIIDTGIDRKDYCDLSLASNYNRQLVDAMIELKKKDPIEYETKMIEFRKESERIMDEADAVAAGNLPKCPTCGSTNIERISVGKKLTGGALFGLLSSNVRKTMHCRNCGYKW